MTLPLLEEQRSRASQLDPRGEACAARHRRPKRRGQNNRYDFFFIGTSDPRINASRVAGRVMAGGHTVPLEKIVSRYSKSIGNLSVAIRLADRVYVYDNSIDGIEAKLLARTSDGSLRKVYGSPPQWIADAIDGLPKHPAFADTSKIPPKP